MSNVGIIGGGLGGLAAACTLAARGHKVTLLEKNTWLGGKAAVLEEGGFRCRRLLPDGGQPHPAGHGGPGTLPEAGISKQLSENLLSGEKGLFRHAEGPGAAPLEAIPGPVFCRLRFNIGPR